jgi:hypothetical protein
MEEVPDMKIKDVIKSRRMENGIRKVTNKHEVL